VNTSVRKSPTQGHVAILSLWILLFLISTAVSASAQAVLVHDFDSLATGQYPDGRLLQASDGFLYGMTRMGGATNGAQGTIFKLLPDGTSFSIIKSFNCAFTLTNPCVPSQGAGLIQLADGYLYGTTNGGGANRAGTVFKILPDGTNFTVIKSFNGTTDGCIPNGLVQGLDTFLYGTNQLCGTGNAGTAFKLLPNGDSFSVIKSFTCLIATDGCRPHGELIQSVSDGFLYGTTESGGANCAFSIIPNGVGCDGLVFKLSTNGLSFSILKSLDCVLGGPGCSPIGGLIQLDDGFLYGNAGGGGANGVGTVFRILPDGTLFSVLHNSGDPAPGGLNDGIGPIYSLLHLGDDFLYGVAADGGISASGGLGTLFKLARNGGGFTVLHTFGFDLLGAGFHPNSSLILANDGNIYGTTNQGGQALGGGIYRLPGPIVVKQTPAITWSNPADIIYGTALSATQLNATASVPGTFTYTPVLGNVLNAANGQTLHADFAPTDIANYNNASANVSINVLQATTTISVNNMPNNVNIGGTFTPTFTYAGDGIKSVTSSSLGTCTVSGGIVSFVGAGPCTVVAHATAGVNYAAANGSPQSFTILRQTPVITWNNPANIVYGTALGNTQLNATANVAGAFAYIPATGTVLNAGNGQSLHVDFTPTDTVNNNNASRNVSINVLQATTTISVTNLPGNVPLGGSFAPTYAYSGDGIKSVTSSTLGNCTVSGGIVSFVGAGTCTVVAHATAGVNYAAANGSPQSFAITDGGVNEQLIILVGSVKSMNLSKGRETSLISKLASPPTCRLLQDFINEVSAQTGKSISLSQANQLNNAANALRLSLGCSP
jgi:uncharacterized repeat protein (TIGR03803 family)